MSTISFALIGGTVWHWAYWIAHDGSIIKDYLFGTILMILEVALIGLFFGWLVYGLTWIPSVAALSAFDTVREHLGERRRKQRAPP